MSAITEALSVKSETFVENRLPPASYICRIVDAELMGSYWDPNEARQEPARWEVAYVPQIEIIDWVRTGDPTLDEETQEKLEQFGDWEGFRPAKKGRVTFRKTVPGYEDPVEIPGGAKGLNFTLFEAEPEWTALIKTPTGEPKLAPYGTMFYQARNQNGQVDGFVVNTLSTSPSQHVPPVTEPMELADIIEATKDCYLVVHLDYEVSEKDGKSYMRITGTSHV